MIRALDERTLISGQLLPEHLPELRQQGVTMIVNNRPDDEEPAQPAGSEIEAAAGQAGIAYRHMPIFRGIGPADVEAMQEAMREAGEGKLLAFCRSGTRSALALALAKREEGVPREEVERSLTEAGIDPGPIAHLL